MYQDWLTLINDVNSLYKISYTQYSSEDKKFIGSKQLRPVHYAVFTDDWDHHGRLYTGQYGHQSLRKLERQTITFNDSPSAEKDYGGMHTRILYHLKARIDYRDDPYKLWGDKTTKDLI